MENSIVEVDEISVKRGDTKVLWGASLHLKEDEINLLIGPNGHGKSTLVETISGLHKVDEGTIRFRGEEITNLPTEEIVSKGIVLIPEDSPIFPHMTVLESLKMGAYTKEAWEKKEENMQKVFDLFHELKERKNQKIWSLSGGERQMTSIGMGIMANPRFLIIDEPTFGLAPALGKKVIKRIKDLKEETEGILLIEESKENIPSDIFDTTFLIKKGVTEKIN